MNGAQSQLEKIRSFLVSQFGARSDGSFGFRVDENRVDEAEFVEIVVRKLTEPRPDDEKREALILQIAEFVGRLRATTSATTSGLAVLDCIERSIRNWRFYR